MPGVTTMDKMEGYMAGFKKAQGKKKKKPGIKDAGHRSTKSDFYKKKK